MLIFYSYLNVGHGGTSFVCVSLRMLGLAGSLLVACRKVNTMDVPFHSCVVACDRWCQGYEHTEGIKMRYVNLKKKAECIMNICKVTLPTPTLLHYLGTGSLQNPGRITRNLVCGMRPKGQRRVQKLHRRCRDSIRNWDDGVATKTESRS